MVSIMFMLFAVVFGLIQKKFNFSGWKEFVLGVVFIVVSFAIGMKVPIILGKDGWSYIVFAYIFIAAIMPIWLMKQPRDYMTTIMFVCMIAGAALGLIIGHPTMNLQLPAVPYQDFIHLFHPVLRLKQSLMKRICLRSATAQ